MEKELVETGIFRIRDGKEVEFLVRVSRRDAQNGSERRYFRQERAPNLTVARKRKHELLKELDGLVESGPSITLRAFVLNHFYERLEASSRPSTAIRTKSSMNANILPILGDKALTRISANDIASLISLKMKDKSGQSQRHILSHFRAIFREAILRGYVKENPALNVERPRLNRKDPLVLKEREIKLLLQHLRANQPVMFYHVALAVLTLARAGELRALTWADVDFERRLITISKTNDPKTGLKECPKNGQSRQVPINPELAQILLELRNANYTCESDLVLPHWREFADGEQGKPLKLILSALNLPPIRFHDLRATGITLMLTQRVPHSVIMKISGHKSISSFNIYLRLAGVEVEGETDHISLLDTPFLAQAESPIDAQMN